MSSPCFGWAIEQGRERSLPSAERFVLLVLSNRANGSLICWPSLPTIAGDTGLSPRTVFGAVHALATKKLIEITRFGRRLQYRILRPKDHDKPPEPTGPLQPLQASQELSTGLPINGHDLQLSQPLQGSMSQSVRVSTPDSCKSCITTLANGDSETTPKTRRKLPVSGQFESSQTTKKENLERKAIFSKSVLVGSKQAELREDRPPTVAEIEASRRAYTASCAALPGPLAEALGKLGSKISKVAYNPAQKTVRSVGEQIDATARFRPVVRGCPLPDDVLAVMPHRQQAVAFAMAPA